MDDDNWDAFSGTMLMNPKEVDELRIWTGPPLFYLPIMKALENSRLALHARQAGRVFGECNERDNIGGRRVQMRKLEFVRGNHYNWHHNTKHHTRAWQIRKRRNK